MSPYQSGRGGPRSNAGRKPRWNHSDTVPIRVPSVFVEQVINYTEKLDSGSVLDFAQNQNSNEIIAEILSDCQLTRNGKDRAAIRRALTDFVERADPVA